MLRTVSQARENSIMICLLHQALEHGQFLKNLKPFFPANYTSTL